MLRVSRLADYGILLLTRLARDPERMHNARDLARETDLPLPTVSKILKTLTRGGILVSHRGVQGGYSLSRPPSEVTVLDVVATFDGPIALTRCAEGPGLCSFEHGCTAGTHFTAINDAIVGALGNLRLSALLAPAPPQLITIGRAPAAAVRPRRDAR